MPDYPHIPPQHDTDREATALVNTWLAREWLVRPVEKDYGLDYLIERIDGGSPSGAHVFVQQKGTSGVRFSSAGTTSFSLETRLLRYYLERVERPVFLFLVDVRAGRGWFTHLQAAVAEDREKLARQQTLAITLSASASLTDAASFASAVAKAIAFQRELHPSSLQAAFRATAEAQQSIDPNFAVVGAKVYSTHTQLKLAPCRDFSIHIKSRPGTHVGEKLAEFLNFGRELHLTSEEVEFSGTKLFESARENGLLSSLLLKAQSSRDCEIILTMDRGRTVLRLVGTLTTGPAGGLIVVQVPGAPLGLELKTTRATIERGGFGHVQILWDHGRWTGKNIRGLPCIESIATFWSTLFSRKSIDTMILLGGSKLARGSFGRKRPNQHFRPHFELCAMLLKLHEVATACKFDLLCPPVEKLFEFDWADIDIAHDLVFKGKHERMAPHLRWIMKPAPNNEKMREAAHQSEPWQGWLKLEQRPYLLRVLGGEFDLGPAASEAGPVVLTPSLEEPGSIEAQALSNTHYRVQRLDACEQTDSIR